MGKYIVLCLVNTIYLNLYRFIFSVKSEKAACPFPVYLVREDGFYALSRVRLLIFMSILLLLEIKTLYKAYDVASKQETEKKKIKSLIMNFLIYIGFILTGVVTLLFTRTDMYA